MTLKQNGMKDFDKDAAQWDASPTKVRMANDVGAAIIREVKLTKDMDVMDFGCGTGLLTLKLQPLVKSITGVDSSQGMLGVLQNKIGQQSLDNVFTRLVDFEHGKHTEGSYDLIVSSMVLHHVPDTQALFKDWAGLLRPGGQVSFADLDAEDGSFHSDNTGVFHFGFERDELKRMLHEAGFGDFRAITATVIDKETKGQGVRQYPVFLVSATRA
ncbi:MAG: class I SAM-dependent methyltransferase [Gammaproteobacteria bacterium]|nr:class I SAM-dependent methyltransferase [Gammaproteobacteria bacterium]MBU1775734.1 class I SAM-dependent methyltransferase [Gammaproteobacteria bacterium]MBU1969361.1 class I SAM-dependent methyltransferase [Gammaproteobacteria bacterium]